MNDCAGMIEQSNGRFFTVCFTKKDTLLVIAIGLALAALTLAYFDVL